MEKYSSTFHEEAQRKKTNMYAYIAVLYEGLYTKETTLSFCHANSIKIITITEIIARVISLLFILQKMKKF